MNPGIQPYCRGSECLGVGEGANYRGSEKKDKLTQGDSSFLVHSEVKMRRWDWMSGRWDTDHSMVDCQMEVTVNQE